MAHTKTYLKSRIDAIFAEVDVHTDLTPKQRAAMRAKLSDAINQQLILTHDTVPLLSREHRAANIKGGK